MRSKKSKALLVASAALMAAPAFASCPSMGTYSVSGITLNKATLGEAVNTIIDSTAWSAEVSDPTNAVVVSLRDVSGPMDMVLEKLIRQAGTASGASIAVRRDTNSCALKLTVNARPSAPENSDIPSLVDISVPGVAPESGFDVSEAREQPPVTVERLHLQAVPATVERPHDQAVPATVERPHDQAVPATVPLPHDQAVPATVPLPREIHQLPAGKFLSAALIDYAEKEGWKVRWLIPTDYMLDVEVPLPKADFKANVIWLVETYQMQGGLLGIRPRFTSNRVFVLESMRPDGDEK